MGTYIFKRIGISIVTVLVLVTVTFTLTRMMPGSPFQNGAVSGQILDAMEEEYGLGESFGVQLTTYMGSLLHGDLGISYQKPGVTVETVIRQTAPITFSIGIPAFFFALLAGTVLGVFQARAKNRCTKGLLFAGAAFFSGIPSLVTTLALSLLFGVFLGWFPIVGLLTPAHYVLPVLSLALYPTAVVARLVNTAYTETQRQDFVLLARAKGLLPHTILWKHILRHAMVPVVSYMGTMTAYLLTGSFVVESIFTIPGLGRAFVHAIANRDYTLILGLTVFMGIMVILSGMLADIICKMLNPGIHYASYERTKCK